MNDRDWRYAVEQACIEQHVGFDQEHPKETVENLVKWAGKQRSDSDSLRKLAEQRTETVKKILSVFDSTTADSDAEFDAIGKVLDEFASHLQPHVRYSLGGI